jgi:hypothetical protein
MFMHRRIDERLIGRLCNTIAMPQVSCRIEICDRVG